VKVNVEAATLIVDDLGEIIGDLHNVACNILYRGKDGKAGSGKIKNFVISHLFDNYFNSQ
jgi:hypothetical protein